MSVDSSQLGYELRCIDAKKTQSIHRP